jgi:hypothetical protein
LGDARGPTDTINPEMSHVTDPEKRQGTNSGGESFPTGSDVRFLVKTSLFFGSKNSENGWKKGRARGDYSFSFIMRMGVVFPSRIHRNTPFQKS